MSKSYAEYVLQQATRNPCLQSLVDYLQDKGRRQTHSVTISCLDFARDEIRPPKTWEIKPWDGEFQTGAVPGRTARLPPVATSQMPRRTIRDQKLREVTTVPEEIHGRVIVMENIDRHTVSHFGALYDIHPLFFATYLNSEFCHLEERPPPPSLAIAPSRTIKKDSIHLHYQRVLDLGKGSRQLRHTLQVSSNVNRSVKPTPPLSDCCLALARTCCSILLRVIGQEKWICLVLVDPTNAELCSRNQFQKPNLKQKPLHGGLEDVCEFPDFSSWARSNQARGVQQQGLNELLAAGRLSLGDQESLLDRLIRHFRNQPAFMSTQTPNLLDFLYYPAQLMISEWLRYSLLLSRYVKHYEYALVSSNLSLKQSKIEELLPWRRRCTGSLRKLELLRMFIESHVQETGSGAEGTWKPILRDVDHVSSQIAHWAAFLNSMVPLLDTHQSLIEAQIVRRLTYIVLAFTSLSLVASILSMSDHVLPWGGHIWIYFAIAVPLTAVILSSYLLVPKILGRL